LYFKIIATTDVLKYYTESESVNRIKDVMRIPQTPKSFIKEFCKSKGTIKEVLVECEANPLMEEGDDLSNMWKLKLNPDKTVIISYQKDFFKTNELIQFKDIKRELNGYGRFYYYILNT
jgi:hypothetical protein